MSTDGRSPIVVTVDHPPIGHAAALWSACLAERLSCPLRIVYVTPASGDSSASIGPKRTEVTAKRQQGAMVVDSALAAVRRSHPELVVTGGLIDGPAEEALANVEEDARMVVLGHPEVGVLDVLAATFHSAIIADHAICPVIVWRGWRNQLPDRSPVILAVAGDSSDTGAAVAAFHYASLFGASVLPLYVGPEQPAATTPTERVAAAPAEPGSLDADVAAAREVFPDVTVAASAEISDAALSERVIGAQLVVTGADGHAPDSAVRGFGADLFRHSRCPVMICPSRTPPVGLGANPLARPAPPISGVQVRTLTPDDREAVAALHRQMSAHDARLRFFSPLPKHIEAFAEQLCLHDSTHLALGAFEGADLVGVANYVVTDATPGHGAAEIALAVAANDQRHGIGTLLVRRLGTAAYLRGVDRLTADILTENTLMLAIIAEQGWKDALRYEGSTAHLDLELDAHRQDQPARIG
ncbi:universal stress protein [Nocardia abscessus]|uniref:universal stress protein n=1 Tax=Nocardia abscessus TaxID=120957 RepID=UPI001895D2C8|nr:universal stress protein [Nocardia abscessus]MBF6223417.1 universal stress protein [Nocardia abscessus]